MQTVGPGHMRGLMWCIWFALIMGAPYAPAGGAGWSVGAGPTSLSNVFAWAALGILAGMWLTAHPRVAESLHGASRVWAAVAYAGLAASVLFALVVWMGLACTFVLGSGEAVLAGMPEFAETAFQTVARMMGTVLSHAAPLALACGVACGSAAPLMLQPPCPEEEPGLVAPCGRSRLELALLLVLGTSQPLAWMLLMPHGAFPQIDVAFDAVSPSSMWSTELTGGHVLMTLVPSILMFAVARVFIRCPARWSVCGRPTEVIPFIVLCSGVLMFRVVSRVAPGVFRTPLWLAVAALAAYACVFAAVLVLAGRRGCAGQVPGQADDCPAPSPERETDTARRIEPKDVLTKDGLAYLQAQGLTEREIDVACAFLQGQTSAQTGQVLGIAEPTVREYRRRCRVKLHVEGSASLAAALPQGSLVREAEMDGAGVPSVARTLDMALPACLTCCTLLALLPAQGMQHVWNDVWITSFGMAFGLLLAPPLVCWMRALESRANRRLFAVGLVSVLALSLLVLSWLRLDAATLVWRAAVRKLVLLACTATACASLLVMLGASARLLERGGAAAHVRLVSAATGACVAALAARLGALPACVVMLAVAVFGSVCLLLAVRPGGGVRLAWEAPDNLPASPWSLGRLAASAVVFWTWGEVWRASWYVSPLGVLQWCSLGLLALTVAGAWSRGVVTRRGIEALSIQYAFVFLVAGMAYADVTTFVLLAVSEYGRGQAGTDRRTLGAWDWMWSSPCAVGAFGRVAGTLATNAVGYLLMRHVSVAAWSSRAGYMVAALFVLAVLAGVACRARGTRCHPDAPTQPVSLVEDARLAALRARGLSEMQARVAISLVEGHSVHAIAQEMGYSRSAVCSARARAYQVLGVHDREGLMRAIENITPAQRP